MIPSDVGFMKVDGVEICINTMSLTITNTLIEVSCLSDIAPKAYRLGKTQKIEIKIDPELDDATVGHFIKALNNQTGSFEQEFSNPDNPAEKYTLNLSEIGFVTSIPAMTNSEDLERMDTTLTVQNQAATLTRV